MPRSAHVGENREARSAALKSSEARRGGGGGGRGKGEGIVKHMLYLWVGADSK